MAVEVHRFAPRYGETPKLADVMAQEVSSDGQNLWALRRSGAPADEGIVLSADGVAIAVLFDGTRDLRSVQQALYEKYGQLLYVERIHELATALHKNRLFEGLVRDEPSTNPERQARLHLPTEGLRGAHHAGTVYSAEPHILRAQLGAYFLSPEGPGVIVPRLGATIRPLKGIVSPHIDPPRGGPTYAYAWKEAAERSDADLFVVFGTAHKAPKQLFTATRRHYNTPLGPVPTDSDALAILERELGPALFEDEAFHDHEHSIELQAIFIRYLNENRPVSMLPILCSSLPIGALPRAEPAIDAFLAALAKATVGRKVLYVAAADFAHLGKLYGDASGLSFSERETLKQRDLTTISRIEAGDADGFYKDAAPDAETRRICGLTPIYMLMRATDGSAGRLLKYAQWHGTEEASAVTYAAMAIEDR